MYLEMKNSMNDERFPIKSKMTEVDTRWRTKGGAHKVDHHDPHVCTNCRGTGVVIHGLYHADCPVCGGIGELG